MMKNLSKNILQLFFLSACVVAGSVSATDMAMPNTPIVVTGNVESNLMLLFDTSGSMRNVVDEEVIPSIVDGETYYSNGSALSTSAAATVMAALTPYDENKSTYLNGSCSGSNDWTSNVYARYYNGVLKFSSSSSGTRYQWGTSGSSKCFLENRNYSAFLQDWTSVPGGAGRGTYSGHYLNWYFSNASSNSGNPTGPEILVARAKTSLSGNNRYRKMGGRDRLMVSISAVNNLMAGLNDLRVGLAKYQYTGSASGSASSTGYILHGLHDIDDITVYSDSDGDSENYREELEETVSDLDVSGNTPLSSATAAMGMYFSHDGSSSGVVTSQTLTKGSNASSSGTTQPSSIFSSGNSSIDSNSSKFYASAGRDLPTPTNMPIQHQCQKSFLLTLTDGEPSADNLYTSTLGRYGDGQSSSSNDWDDATLALYDMDLRPDLVNPVDDSNNPLYVNNVTSYIVGFGPTFDSGSSLGARAAANGGGTFYTAQTEQELINTLTDVTTNITNQNGSLAAIAFDATSIQVGGLVYQAKFHTKNWTGSLLALPFQDVDGTIGSLGDTGSWEAREQLNTLVGLDGSGSGNRVILSYDGSDGVAFRWDTDGNDSTVSTAILSADLQSDLQYGSPSSVTASEAQDRLNYLRGATTNEGNISTNYRDRRFGESESPASFTNANNPNAGLLGDIVNSAPVYVGEAGSDWPDSLEVTSYSSWASSLSRTPIVYVGANDGMLHGFNATTGVEVMAYVPGVIANNSASNGLHYLIQQDYDHQNYVDLTPSVADIFIDVDNDSTDAWATVLIGGLRAGGKGYFALDITDPTSFSESGSNPVDVVLWEFTDANDSDLGYTFSRPAIAKMNNGKWAAIFGNGYNSTNGDAALFILYIEEGIDGWASGEWVKISTGVGAAGDKNGLSSPSLWDEDNDGDVDRIYAGDLKGNMWVFDVSNANINQWDSAYKQSGSPRPLFTALNGSTPRPITEAPRLSINEDYSGSDPNVMVLFGTGKYIEVSDLSDGDTQAFYGVSDNGSGELTAGNLFKRHLSIQTINGRQIRFTTDDANTNSVDETRDINWGTEHGWYMELEAGSGTSPNIIGAERVVSSPVVVNDLVAFSTIIPDGSPCQTTGGSGWIMALDYNTGLSVTDRAIFDADNDGAIENVDDLGAVGFSVVDGLPSGVSQIGSSVGYATSTGDVGVINLNVDTSGVGGRKGWEEVSF